jgi:hypothetical protein
MKNKNWASNHWQQLLVATLAILVFCFWLFLYPHILTMREQSQLFLWTWDYFTERITTPGGFAQYIAECLVQFFRNPVYGACIYAILFLLTYGLSRQLLGNKYPLLSFLPPLALWGLSLFPYIPLTPTIAIILLMTWLAFLPQQKKGKTISMIILLPVIFWMTGPGIADYYWEEERKSTLEEMRYDLMVRMKDWTGIVEEFHRHPSPSLAIQHAERLAEYYLKRIPEEDLYRADVFSNLSLHSESSAFIMDEVYFHLGLVNMSQRATFEAMESIPSHNKSGRALSRLVETSLITGQYEVALKYISILEDTSLYRTWARKMKPLAEHPQLIRQHPVYRRLQEIYQQTDDTFFY